uniref:Fe2OG dioxygenase domain-containing protein n=1 Tax=Macrostomum lignano TaxID=282301 RepID=A0A1I8JCX4_9PLAT
PEARKIVWFGPEYTYGGTKISANDNWHPLVTSLATWLRVEYQLPVFNSCLINFYKDGSINIPWHSDDEVELGPNPTIASISIGATRDFHMRPKGSTNIAWSQRLASGSLLVMSGATQSHLQHAVLKDPKVKELRVNLTFRLTHDARIPEELPVSDQANPCIQPVDNSITCDLDDEDSVRRRAELEAENLRRIRSRSNSSTGRKPSSQQPTTQISQQKNMQIAHEQQSTISKHNLQQQASMQMQPQQPPSDNSQQTLIHLTPPTTTQQQQQTETKTTCNSQPSQTSQNNQLNQSKTQSQTSQLSSNLTSQPNTASSNYQLRTNDNSKPKNSAPVIFEIEHEGKDPIKFEWFLKNNFPEIRIKSVKDLYHSSGYIVTREHPKDYNKLLTAPLKTNKINEFEITRRMAAKRPVKQGDDQVYCFIVKHVPIAVDAKELAKHLVESEQQIPIDGAVRIISKATGEHFSADCPKDRKFECANCGGEHPQFSFKCQKIKEANEIATRKAHEKIRAQREEAKPSRSLGEAFGVPGPLSYADAMRPMRTGLIKPILGPIAYSNRAAAAAAAAAASAASDAPPAEAPANRTALTNPAAIQISANPPTLPAVASDSVAAPNLGVENANDTRKSSERGLISRMGVLEVVLQALTRLMGTNPGQMLTEWEAGQLAIQAVTEVLAALRNRRGPDSGTGDTEAAQAGGDET